jgi:ribosomal protein S18 acetylase RimI-like enzyme
MSEKIILRNAIQPDVKAITEIYIASRKVFVSFAPLIHSEESVYQWIDNIVATQNLTLAEKNGAIVGMMALSKKHNTGWIEQLYIAPSAVGQGIGSLLVKLAKQTLGAPIRLHTFQQNINAQRFYQKLGFQIIELRDGSANEEHCPDAVFEWAASVY